jgi:cytoskeletal protein CcmA (bactofilin family)
MFHRPKAENDQLNFNKAPEQKVQEQKVEATIVEEKAVIDPIPQAEVTPSVSTTEAPSQSLQTLKDKIFETKKDTSAIEDKKMSETEENNTVRAPEIPSQASAFQKPGVGPRIPGAYPGSFPGATNSVYGSSVSASSNGSVSPVDGEARKLVVGQGITMSGEIECCDTLLVEGTVEAALKGASVLVVAETGVFYGTVEIDEATIAGRFEGDLKVNGRLTVKATGSITGSIVYKELAIDAGATIDGKVSPLDGSKIQSRKDGIKKVEQKGSELPLMASN